MLSKRSTYGCYFLTTSCILKPPTSCSFRGSKSPQGNPENMKATIEIRYRVGSEQYHLGPLSERLRREKLPPGATWRLDSSTCSRPARWSLAWVGRTRRSLSIAQKNRPSIGLVDSQYSYLFIFVPTHPCFLKLSQTSSDLLLPSLTLSNPL